MMLNIRWWLVTRTLRALSRLMRTSHVAFAHDGRIHYRVGHSAWRSL